MSRPESELCRECRRPTGFGPGAPLCSDCGFRAVQEMARSDGAVEAIQLSHAVHVVIMDGVPIAVALSVHEVAHRGGVKQPQIAVF